MAEGGQGPAGRRSAERLERLASRCGCGQPGRMFPPLDVWVALTVAVGALSYAGFFVGSALGWW